MSEEIQAATEAAEPVTLDSIIGAALSKHDADFEDTPKPEVPPDKEAAPAKAQTDERPRDERGRFASGEPKPPQAGTAEAAPQAAAAAAPDPAAKPIEAPRNYTAAQKADFAKLPRDAQDFLSRSEAAREAEYSRRSNEIAEYRRTADPLVQAVQPYMEYLQQRGSQLGQSPVQMVNSLLQTAHYLDTADEPGKYRAFANLAQQFKVDLRAFANGQMPVQPQPAQVQYNPELQRIQAELEEHRQWRAQVQEQAELHHSQQQIAAFAAAKDDAGQPKYPHLDRVRAAMASYMQTGQADTLEQAYELAIAPFKELIEQEMATRQKAAEDERKAALEKAKKAAPVRSSTGSIPASRADPKSLDDHLNAAMDKYF